MKICLIQPEYSFDERDLEKCFEGLITQLDICDSSMDIIVLPEYSDAPADVKGKGGFYNAVAKNGERLLEAFRNGMGARLPAATLRKLRLAQAPFQPVFPQLHAHIAHTINSQAHYTTFRDSFQRFLLFG